MPKRLTKYLNGFIEIEYFDITPQEELELMTRFCGVVSFPSVNHRSQLKNRKAVSSDTNDVSSGASHDKEK